MLEQIYKSSWIEKGFHGLFVGFIYSLIGVFVASLLFFDYTGIASLAFVAALLIPTFNSFIKLMALTGNKRHTSFSIFRAFSAHWDVIKASLFLFLGIFIAYSLLGFLFSPKLVNHMFTPQLKAVGIQGLAMQGGLFSSIVLNNLLVMAVSFFIAFILGAGAIIFLIWNASVWGMALTYFVRETVTYQGGNPIMVFFGFVLPFLPHLLTEAFAYVGAAIVGGIVSKAVLTEKFNSPQFNGIIKDALILMAFAVVLVIVGAIIEVNVSPLV